MDKDTEVQANLKIPKSLKDKLKAAAKENHRSMTSEVIARLEDSFKISASAGLLDLGPQTAREFLEEQRTTVKQYLEMLEKLERERL